MRAQMQEAALRISDSRITVDNSRRTGTVGNGLDGRRCVQGIPCIQKDHIVARSTLQSLVHRVIQSLVGLRPYQDLMPALVFIVPGNGHRVILRSTINNQMLYQGIGLAGHTVEGTLQAASRIISDCDNGNAYHHTLLYISI